MADGFADGIDEGRLWGDLMRLAEFGARDDGGVCRHALSDEDIAARAWLIGQAQARGYSVSVDEAANLFIRRAGRDDALAPVLTGSHMDSQPAGGKFDGAYGVLAGLEVLRALDDAGIETVRPVEVVAWTNEEGGRFHATCTGSHSFADRALSDPDQADEDGVTLTAALEATLAATPDLPRRPLGFPVQAYVEAHIEQGPVLEREDTDIGVVTGIQGARWYAAEVTGEPGHAGTVPHAARRDALLGALRAVAALSDLTEDADDVMRFTVGRLNVEPNSPNTIPAKVRFSIDVRHPDLDTLDACAARIAETVTEAAAPCTVDLVPMVGLDPVAFPAAITGAVDRAAQATGLTCRPLPSGAFHDAAFIASVAPTGMIFIPCRDGLSHHPDEWAEPVACANGARVLAGALAELAARR